MYAKSTRPSAKREVQKERSAKRDDQIALPRLYTESGLLLNPPFKLKISRTLINNIRHLKKTMDTKLSCSKLGN